jgi:hypothetical protein
MQEKKKPVVSVEVEIEAALPQLRQWRIGVRYFKKRVVNLVQFSKGRCSTFTWYYRHKFITIVLGAIDTLAWKVFRINIDSECGGVSKKNHHDTRRAYRLQSPRNYYRRNTVAAYA